MLEYEYAKAVLELALEQGLAIKVKEELDVVTKLLDDNDFRLFREFGSHDISTSTAWKCCSGIDLGDYGAGCLYYIPNSGFCRYDR